MAVEGGAREGVAFCHLLPHPPFVEFIKRHPPMTAESVDEPDILLEDQCRFHRPLALSRLEASG